MTREGITGKDIEFKGTGGPLTAYLAAPTDGGKHPGVIVIHEIWGLNAHIKDVADRIASQGYVALAPHLFSSKHVSPLLTEPNIRAVMDFYRSIPPEKQRETDFVMGELQKLPEEKRKVVGELRDTLFDLPEDKLTEELSLSVDHLKSLDSVSGKIGSFGFCFGGSMSGLLACTGKTDASVIFYGSNPDPIDSVKKIKGAIMGIYGGLDKRINSGLPELVKAMAEYEKPFEMCIYPGAPHAFFNDTSPQNYREAAAKDAWERLLRFFTRHLG